jgi:DNA polymerase-3 subunit delta
MIIFLYGEDTFRSRQKLKALKEKFRQEVDKDGSSLVLIDGVETDLGKINEAVASSSLFSRKRMIIIERIFSNKSKNLTNSLEELFRKKENDNIVIFWDDISGEKMSKNKFFNFLMAQKFSQNFKALSNLEASNWIIKEAGNNKIKINLQAANAMVAMFGNDLWTLNNEIEKLVNQKQGEGSDEINVEDISRLEGGKIDENIFAFTDAISQKNKAQALSLFEKEMEAGAADVYLVHMIIRQFRILLQVRQGFESGLSPQQIAGQLKIHPFVVNKTLQQVQKFDLELLKKIFNRLVEIDSGIKSGSSDFKTQISLLIAQI